MIEKGVDMQRVPRLAASLVVVCSLCGCTFVDKGKSGYSTGYKVERLSVQELVAALKSGEIKAGDELPVARLPKGWTGTSVKDTEGSGYGTYVAMDGDHLVMIYVANGGLMYAASAYSDWLRERWFFCDTELLRKHIEASKKSPMSGQTTIRSGLW